MFDLGKSGTKIDDIEVKISYRIIELFSAGLYSSPNKAFEELICNSYDAFADKVSVYFTPDLSSENAFIIVCDNGEGLNQDEFKNLWKIGESTKRTDPTKDLKRLQIGQFGIGKLSTYILCRNLTYISKKENRFIVTTMNYNLITTDTEKLQLDEIEINESEAEALIKKYTSLNGKSMIDFELFGDNAVPSWTISILTSLKPKAAEIQPGRLNWILRTALPLNPSFNLSLNGTKIESAKLKIPVVKKWTIGNDDTTADELSFASSGYDEERKQYFVDFDSLKYVTGTFTLYEDSLLGGKASENGRSHGIFLTIRERLINLDDPLLGMDAFSHGPFNHSRIEINADGLDDNLTSTREAVKESKPLNELKAYIKKKFNNEIRKFYFEEEEKSQQKKSVSYRLSQTAYTTSKRPIYSFIQKFFDGEIGNPILIEKPVNCTKDELLPQYEGDVSENSQVIEKIEWCILDSQSPIAKLDLLTKTLKINALHPYISNYNDSYKSTLPLESLVITEVLTEAHMYELGLDETFINSIMKRRDDTLRQLALSDKEGIPAAAQLLLDALANPTGLEVAVSRALSALGFESQKIGGIGKPDGYAKAVLGYEQNGLCKDYSLTYDAKSTAGVRIAAGTAKLSAIKRHQEDYKATYALEVAIGFAGEEIPDSAISKEATQQKVTVMKASDLVKLLLYSVPKQLGLSKLKDLFETCFTPAQVTAWVDLFANEEPAQGPYYVIIEEIYNFQKTDTEPPTTELIRKEVNAKCSSNFSTEEIRTYIKALTSIIPGQLHYDGTYAYVDCTPEIIKGHITNSISRNIPLNVREIYNAMFK